VKWPLLERVPERDRRSFLAIARRRRFVKDEVVFHAGDLGDTLHLIESGRFGVRVTTPLGETAMLSLLGPGDFFGVLALLDADARRTATVTALEKAETLSIRKEDFERIRREQPSVNEVLIGALGHRVEALSDSLLQALYTPVEARVLRCLLDAARLWGGPSEGVVIPLTQDDIAELAGTTRQTANRVLKQAEERGLVRISRGRVEIVDPLQLARRAGSNLPGP